MEEWYGPIILVIVIFVVVYIISGFRLGLSTGLGAFTGGIVIYFTLRLNNSSSRRRN
ncbi:hypothetical protein MUN89_17195 [Halobacillus salinarum]|uniref:Uncharacterized protein n=1 Tax=Halobacillus salinarum TaxID=2932257 RepID=A0ABY4EHJ5_9BACI|nr:hypothetical protein [Halobacillus salinarum]UOQ43624.1 hypothetical protein MUN89_17195 [Halobacillus salinarum]